MNRKLFFWAFLWLFLGAFIALLFFATEYTLRALFPEKLTSRTALL